MGYGMETKELIRRYQARTKEEKDAQETMLQALEKVGEPLLHRTMPYHFTVSALVLNPEMNRVLMVHHNLFGTFTWPGGHTDGETDLLAVALREVREETGIGAVYPLSGAPLSLDLLSCPAHVKNEVPVPGHTHFCVTFGCVAPEGQPLIHKADENSAVKWLPIDELDGMCKEAHMLPLYKKAIARSRALRIEKEHCYALLPSALLPWYRVSARKLPWREDREPYHVWLSEIMLQQTRVEAVKGYYERFLQELPTIAALACAPQDRLMKLWEGLGYYSRVKNLQKAAKIIMSDYGGQFPGQYEQIAALPGIGAYTAGAVASICFGMPTPAVDGNVLRVLARITEEYEPVDTPAVKKRIALLLERIYPAEACGDFTQALMELGATVCLPNGTPLCGSCPARGFCMAYANGSQSQLPKRKPKRMRRVEERTVFVLTHKDRVALRRRTEDGLLGGQWEFPNVFGKETEQAALQIAARWGVRPAALLKRVTKKHVFTHVEWHMVCYYIRCEAETEQFFWPCWGQLEQEIALPTAFSIFKEEIK